jgi:hypothetical protein
MLFLCSGTGKGIDNSILSCDKTDSFEINAPCYCQDQRRTYPDYHGKVNIHAAVFENSGVVGAVTSLLFFLLVGPTY